MYAHVARCDINENLTMTWTSLKTRLEASSSVTLEDGIIISPPAGEF